LILKDVQSGKTLWSPEASGAVKLAISPKGNLTLRNGENVKLWHAGTYNSGADKLVLNNDGSLVLYAGSNAVWSVNTGDDPGPDPDPDTGPDPGANGATLKFIAYGDSRSQESIHKSICTQMNSENPELIISIGDLWGKYSATNWKEHLTSQSNLSKLLQNNKILVAQGNHETSSEVKKFSPSIIKNGSITYSFLLGNVFFVCLGEDPSASYLESQLKKSEAQKAAFRIIFHHSPVYSGGKHGESGNSSIEKICDKYNVTFSFAGHDHHYERSKVIFGGESVHSGTSVPSGIKGTTYIVTGGGGAPLYSANSKWWTDTTKKKHHYCLLTAYKDRIEMVVKDQSGVVIEKFVRKKK